MIGSVAPGIEVSVVLSFAKVDLRSGLVATKDSAKA